MQDLPSELWLVVSEYLDRESRLQFSSTCTRIRDLLAKHVYGTLRVDLTKTGHKPPGSVLRGRDLMAIHSNSRSLGMLSATTGVWLSIQSHPRLFPLTIKTDIKQKERIVDEFVTKTIARYCTSLRWLFVRTTANNRVTGQVSELIQGLDPNVVDIKVEMIIHGMQAGPKNKPLFGGLKRLKLVIPDVKTMCYRLPDGIEDLTIDSCGQCDEMPLEVLVKRLTTLKRLRVQVEEFWTTTLRWIPFSVDEVVVCGTHYATLDSAFYPNLLKRTVPSIKSLHVPNNCCLSLKHRIFADLERFNAQYGDDGDNTGVIQVLSTSSKLKEFCFPQAYTKHLPLVRQYVQVPRLIIYHINDLLRIQDSIAVMPSVQQLYLVLDDNVNPDIMHEIADMRQRYDLSIHFHGPPQFAGYCGYLLQNEFLEHLNISEIFEVIGVPIDHISHCI